MSILLALVLMVVFLSPVSHAQEEKKERVLVLGAGITLEEKAQLLKTFGIEDESKIKVATVTAKDYEKYLGVKSEDSSLISSVLVDFNSDKGVQSRVLKPENITLIQNHQYVNAALTSGLQNLVIQVASPRKVTGESALVGVFKASEVVGHEISQEKMEISSNELELLAEISKSSSSQEEELKKISSTLIDIKSEIAKLVASQGKEKVSAEDVAKIVNVNIANVNINLSDETKAKVNELMVQYKDSLSQEEAKSIEEQAKETGKKLFDKANELFNQAVESGFFQKVWDAISGFFTGLWEGISSVFNK